MSTSFNISVNHDRLYCTCRVVCGIEDEKTNHSIVLMYSVDWTVQLGRWGGKQRAIDESCMQTVHMHACSGRTAECLHQHIHVSRSRSSENFIKAR